MRQKKYYILLKEHNTTGLKYLCRHVTKYEHYCYTYKGSGIYWKRHLAKHGEDFSTTILAACDTEQESIEVGLHYSNLWNVAESKEFANLVPEAGQGGADVAKHRKKIGARFGYEQEPNRYVGEDNYAKRPEVRAKISAALKGRVSPTKGWKYPETVCPHCRLVGSGPGMTRYHFGKCKHKPV